jgi:hypothetical protein
VKAERAAAPEMQSAPGGKTGLLVRTLRSIKVPRCRQYHAAHLLYAFRNRSELARYLAAAIERRKSCGLRFAPTGYPVFPGL